MLIGCDVGVSVPSWYNHGVRKSTETVNKAYFVVRFIFYIRAYTGSHSCY